MLVAAAVFLAGFRIGLNVETSNVIDVGYAGVIGAHRIANGEAPYGHMPVQGNLKACGPADAEGEIRERVQTNGRCESSNDRGDTYGPVAYLAYVPGYLALGWTGKWDDLPAAHFTAIAFDLLCMLGLALVGWSFGGPRLAATLPFAWAAYPFTQYASSSNTNDTILPALLICGFFLAASARARGALRCARGLDEVRAARRRAALGDVPGMERASRRALRRRLPRRHGARASRCCCSSRACVDAARTFWDRTLGWQLGRESPFSIWDWGQYHARGIPDLHLPHQFAEGARRSRVRSRLRSCRAGSRRCSSRR